MPNNSDLASDADLEAAADALEVVAEIGFHEVAAIWTITDPVDANQAFGIGWPVLVRLKLLEPLLVGSFLAEKFLSELSCALPVSAALGFGNGLSAFQAGLIDCISATFEVLDLPIATTGFLILAETLQAGATARPQLEA
ncbi:MAG: hypothetical protein ABR884_00040 [Minisyncoccia bacterium]